MSAVFKAEAITANQYLTGTARRWHTHEGANQTVADHSWGVAFIITMLHPNPSANLLKAALLHDCGEYFSGDIPSPAKTAFPELREASKKAEAWAMQQLKLPSFPLTQEERDWLDMADKYEAYLFSATRAFASDVARQIEAIRAEVLVCTKKINLEFIEQGSLDNSDQPRN